MKNSDIRDLSVADLNEKLASLRKEFSELKISHTVSALENPMQIRVLRKTIARIATELSNRELHNS
jgi:large subunit ribosomal protein L29